MKTISLYQPWASAMALGLKLIETRGTQIHHRGRCAIHAAKKWTEELEDETNDFAYILGAPKLVGAPRGVIVAVGTIVDCKPTTLLRDSISNQERMLGNYADGRFGWIFEDIVALEEPIPYRGQQGQWDTPDHLFPTAVL